MKCPLLGGASEQGWSYIAEWTGVRLATILNLAGTGPESRYVVFEPFANPNQSRTLVRVLFETIDMADALHPQTRLAYDMNGEALPPTMAPLSAFASGATSAGKIPSIFLELSSPIAGTTTVKAAAPGTEAFDERL